MSLETILNVARRRGIDCLAITDHNTTLSAREMKAIAPLSIIVGEEIKTTRGEIIGLFLERDIPPRLSPEETVSRIKEQGGLVCVPHPFDRLRKSRLATDSLMAVAPQIDMVEVYNSRITFQADNALAVAFADRFGLLQVGGSDAHSTIEIGKTYVEMAAFTTKEEFLRGVAQGKVVGRLSSPLVHFLSGWSKLKKKYLR
ncbi:MAG: PHP domain-containing protein [Chloroflexi bacterium]|nr:PHP domain-containing protein [Chloroflexota bacterium]